MRALGIDLGSKRIGIAVSDRSGTIASPLTVVQRSGSKRRDHEAIARLVTEEEAELVVVGLPRSMNGSLGPAAKAAQSETQGVVEVRTALIDHAGRVPSASPGKRRCRAPMGVRVFAAGTRALSIPANEEAACQPREKS